MEPDPYLAPSSRASATLSLPRPFPASAGDPAIMAPPPTRSVVALPADVLTNAVAPDPCNHATARDCTTSTDPSPPPAIGRAFTITVVVAVVVAFIARDGAMPRLQRSRARTHRFP